MFGLTKPKPPIAPTDTFADEVIEGTRQPIPVEAFRPHNHAFDCDYHLDQYPHECSCGFTAKAMSDASR